MKIPLKNYHKDFCQKEIIKLYNLNLFVFFHFNKSSNNTNKLSPQEQHQSSGDRGEVQIIQINLVLKNFPAVQHSFLKVQIIQINLVLKNLCINSKPFCVFK